MGERAGIALFAALAGAAPASAAIAAKNPLLTLSERAPAAEARTPDAFPVLRQDADGYWLVDFRHLASFAYTPAPAGGDGALPRDAAPPGQAVPAERLPANVRALDGKRVCSIGYMLPVALEPISAEELADVLETDAVDVTTVLRVLRDEYLDQRRGFH